MKYKLIINLLASLICYLLASQHAMANPYLYSGKSLTGSSVQLQETGPYNDGAFPGSDSFVHFSPPQSYYIYSPSQGDVFIYGDNGKIVNKSIYIPQCWTTYLRVIPKDQITLQPGEGIFNIVNYFPFISYGFFPGVYELATHSAEDQYIGYTAIKDPACIPTHEPLFMSYANYEFGSCIGYKSIGIIEWNRLQGVNNYTLEYASGGNWYTLYSGSNSGTKFTRPQGTYSLRIRASAEGINGPWKRFSARVPSCPGTQPF